MNICVYGASSTAIAKSYINPVEELGKKIAGLGHSVVFGGGNNGLMGAIARGVYAGGGKIIGVSPAFFNVDGVLFEKCTEMIYTETMSRRKELMMEYADAFLVVPGGPGTLDEFFETLTLKQLGKHNKPILVYNLNGYYDQLIAQLDTCVDRQFMEEKNMSLFHVFNRADKIITYLQDSAQNGLFPGQRNY